MTPIAQNSPSHRVVPPKTKPGHRRRRGAQALASLSEDDREILLLHAWDSRGAEIAEIFHLSTNAAAVPPSLVSGPFSPPFQTVSRLSESSTDSRQRTYGGGNHEFI